MLTTNKCSWIGIFFPETKVNETNECMKVIIFENKVDYHGFAREKHLILYESWLSSWAK